MSTPVTETSEGLPELGTAQAAVESCVALIAHAVGKPAAAIHYWLDLYYFVRAAYERENAPEPEEAPVFIQPKDLLPALRQLWQEVLSDAGKDARHEKKAEMPAPVFQAEGTEANRAGEETGAEQSAPPPENRRKAS